MLVKSQTELLGLLPQIVELADSEKTALSFWPENQLREAIARERLWAFVDGQRLQGCLVYSGVFPHAKVQLVAVAPSVRKQGVATTLLRSLISELERLGFMSIKAEIASDLQAALAFYKSLGFEESHRRSGGKSRNRKIIVHVLELDTDTLFSVPNGRNVDFDLGLKRRSASEAPFYAIDLNVYLDLVKDREHSENAGRIFWAALDHQIRLAVATEFVAELLRNTTNHRRDPVLKLAMRLPKIPSTDPLELEALSMRILGLVFPRRQSASEITPQSKSDARHLAHAALGICYP